MQTWAEYKRDRVSIAAFGGLNHTDAAAPGLCPRAATSSALHTEQFCASVQVASAPGV